uniref:Uncharacterized protein n=1 Tax=Meloidogyne javanica TaxID=6303 RepID=A0A915MG69_MELJA
MVIFNLFFKVIICGDKAPDGEMKSRGFGLLVRCRNDHSTNFDGCRMVLTATRGPSKVCGGSLRASGNERKKLNVPIDTQTENYYLNLRYEWNNEAEFRAIKSDYGGALFGWPRMVSLVSLYRKKPLEVIFEQFSFPSTSVLQLTASVLLQSQFSASFRIRFRTLSACNRSIKLMEMIARKRNSREKTQPTNLHLIEAIDQESKCTNTDVLMLQWEKNFIFKELRGFVTQSKRGLTPIKKWDRTDIIVKIGREGENETIGVFAWGEMAAELEKARPNNFVSLTNMVVVPEDPAKHETWSGSIDFKLKFTRVSTLNILEGEEVTTVQQPESRPSTSAGGTTRNEDDEDDIFVS